jgi:1,2-diacylglycerol 3-alpha-glucosyltransferase
MRIAVFTNNYLPNPYGVTQSIESFRVQLEKMGHTVFIFAPFDKDYIDKNPNVFRYPSVDIKYKIKFPLAVPWSRKMDEIMKELKVNIIHSQHPVLLGAAAAKWAKAKDVPLVFTWHTLYDHYAHFMPIIPDEWAASYFIGKAVKYANRCDYVITPTRSVGEIIKNWGVTNPNIESIPSGVDENNFLNPDRSSIRKKFGISDSEILLFSICRLTREKNIEFLFRSVVKVLKERVNAKFLIVSDGDMRPEMERLINKENLERRVIFAGIVGRSEIKNYFASGDIFVYASKSETQGMIISEAMYSGLPVVAVQATGVGDLIENGVSGILTEENENLFSHSMIDLIDDHEKRAGLGKAGKEIARKELTASVCAEKMVELYERAIYKKQLSL